MLAPAKSLKPTKPTLARRRRRAWLLLLLLLLVGYGGYRLLRGDPHLKKVRELRAELFTAEAANLPPEERAEKFRQLREESEKLAPESRQALADEGRKRFEAELDRYRAMSPEEKARYLDERIDRAERARQNRQANGAGGPNAAGGPPGGRGAGLGTEDRDRRRKQRLDNSTPEFRAKMDQFIHDMQARRQQRGLPASSGFGGR